MTLLLVAAGAAVGAPLRYLAAHVLDGRLHWGTILVNLVGSFLLGLLSASALSGDTMALLGTGFCGALTTYSAFAVQVHDLGPRKGAVTVALTVVPALALVFLGFWLGAR
ncbi:MAG TPA: CrcB family protein [Nocardioidaceae bacterium]|nr:CrcB family protein [Nocardioidaceae bacterium]